jgi:hypothetical protein
MGGTSLSVYSAPALDASVVGALLPGELLLARGQIVDGWYVGENPTVTGWIPSALVNAYGACDGVPFVLNPLIPTAPEDEAAFGLSVDRDGRGAFSEQLSFPVGDRLDYVWVIVENLYHQPPANFRQFAITLSCSGRGAEFVRWGAPTAPERSCGETIVVPFLRELHQQAFAVLVPEGSAQAGVTYTLEAVSLTGAAAGAEQNTVYAGRQGAKISPLSRASGASLAG